MEERPASEDPERSDNVTIVAETFGPQAATVSSLKSENSTERLICKTPQSKVKKVKENKVEKLSAKSLSASVDGEGVNRRDGGRRTTVVLGACQVFLGALLVGAGGAAVVRGAALSRVGAGLWAGSLAVVTGVLGVLAGINDCYGLNERLQRRSPLLTAFLALSLGCLACGNAAAVLAATGLHRDYVRSQSPTHLVPDNFQDEIEAWAPVLTNIALLIIATAHCLVSLVTIYYLSKRICSCFRPKQHFDHNQFDPNAKPPLHPDHILTVSEKKPTKEVEKKVCEVKTVGKGEFGSANSKEKLVSSWLGRHQPPPGMVDRGGKVRKMKMAPQPVMLLPAHPASTLGRGMAMLAPPVLAPPVLPPPRYATLPLPPPHYPPHIYYTAMPDTRIRRRRSPRGTRVRRRREGNARDSPLTRSLERIHRKRRAERRAERDRLADTQLRQTYTGLDRAYAEQYLAVCDESRSHNADRHDSLTSSLSSSDLTPPGGRDYSTTTRSSHR